MKGKKLLAVQLLLALAAVCFISSPALCDGPWENDGTLGTDGTNGGGDTDRGDDRFVGIGLSQSSGWAPVTNADIGVSIYLFVIDQFFSPHRTLQQGTRTITEWRSRADERWHGLRHRWSDRTE